MKTINNSVEEITRIITQLEEKKITALTSEQLTVLQTKQQKSQDFVNSNYFNIFTDQTLLGEK
jgi:hypothetical protein